MRAGMKANGFDFRVEPIALSDREGAATMFGMSPGSASLLKGWHTEVAMLRRKVRTQTLDNVLGSSFSGAQIFVKLDLEGNEWPALRGACATLCRIPRPIWMVEIVDFAFPGGVHPDREAIFDTFEAHGYAAQEITPGNWIFG
jgi:FkbM family methyltransferase